MDHQSEKLKSRMQIPTCQTSKHARKCRFLTFEAGLVGGWTNPFEKYARQIGANFPKVRGENKKYLGNHQPVVFQRKSLFSTQVGKIQTTTSFTVACASSTYLRRRSVLNFEETKGRNHNNDNPMASRGTWRIIPVSKWLGSPPFTSYWKTWLQKEKCSFWPYVWSLPWVSQYFSTISNKAQDMYLSNMAASFT